MLSIQIVDYIIFLSLSIVLGGLFGSFSTALIHRLPRGIPIAFGRKSHSGGAGDGAARSYCLSCSHQLSALDLIPVVSYLFLRGRCRYCGVAFGRSYFFVECSCIVMTFLTFLYWGISYQTLIFIACIPVLLSLFVIDLKHFILPNLLVLSLWCLGLTARLFVQGEGGMLDAFYGAMLDSAVYGVLALCIGLLFAKILKKDALGFGDVKFYAAAGIWLGPMILPAFMMLSGLLGLLHGGYMRMKYKSVIFPFGPSLIMSLVICYIFKDMFLLYFYG